MTKDFVEIGFYECSKGWNTSKMYEYFNSHPSARVCMPTSYAAAMGAEQDFNYMGELASGCKWWLRSLGYYGNGKYALSVYKDGGLMDDMGEYADATDTGIRPVIVILP